MVPACALEGNTGTIVATDTTPITDAIHVLVVFLYVPSDFIGTVVGNRHYRHIYCNSNGASAVTSTDYVVDNRLCKLHFHTSTLCLLHVHPSHSIGLSAFLVLMVGVPLLRQFYYEERVVAGLTVQPASYIAVYIYNNYCCVSYNTICVPTILPSFLL